MGLMMRTLCCAADSTTTSIFRNYLVRLVRVAGLRGCMGGRVARVAVNIGKPQPAAGAAALWIGWLSCLVSVVSGVVSLGGSGDAVLLQLAIERGLADAQQACGQELVAIQFAQG